MSTYILPLFFLCLLCMAYTLPIVQDGQSSGVGLQSEGALRTLNVLDYNRNGNKVLTRNKRQVIKGRRCARRRIYYKNRCMTFKRYEQLIGDYDT